MTAVKVTSIRLGTIALTVWPMQRYPFFRSVLGDPPRFFAYVLNGLIAAAVAAGIGLMFHPGNPDPLTAGDVAPILLSFMMCTALATIGSQRRCHQSGGASPRRLHAPWPWRWRRSASLRGATSSVPASPGADVPSAAMASSNRRRCPHQIYAEIFEIFGSQARQHPFVDFVIAERLLVLAEP
jgi:hypothetical protein